MALLGTGGWKSTFFGLRRTRISLPDLINRQCTIVTRTESDETDELGNEIPGEDEVETVCEAQPTKIAEPELLGEISDEDWTVFFLPADAQHLNTASAVIVPGLGTLEITGRPPTLRNPRLRQDKFVHARTRLIAGAGDEEGS